MSYTHLTMKERNVIFQMRVQGYRQAEIARCLGCSGSTLSRELRRNADWDARYFPGTAQAKANARGRRHIRRPKTGNVSLMNYVAEKLERRWSPEQIAGRLREVGLSNLPRATISHTTIYRWLWADRERAAHFRRFLRVACKPRRKPYGKPSRRGQIPDRVSIEERPARVDDRRRVGDWEGDTMVGKGRTGYVLTGVERASRYLVARKLDACSADATSDALHHAMKRLPCEKRRTLTVDNGREFARHKDLGRRLGLDVYFAHPYSSWERGTNENTNGLLRQYLPKKTDFSLLTDEQLKAYVRQLNQRPRKCLDYRTPVEMFWERNVALIM